jgi:putative ABC transport system ATP-binding protein
MAEKSSPLLSARGIYRSFKRGSETVNALAGVDLDVQTGEMLSVLGPSGSGKTTLINVLSCLDAPTSGTLLVGGTNVTGMKEDDLVEVRRGVFGFVFQKFYLLPTLTVVENAELPLLFLRREVDRKATLSLLEQVGLGDRASHLPKELSGGQMQRVAIARALIVKPRVLVADEPTGNLDRATGEKIFELFKALTRQGLTVLITTHNLAFGYQADRVITLEDGRVVREEKGK